MDLQRKIQERKLQREREEKERLEQETLEQEERRQHEVEKAVDILKSHPDTPTEHPDQQQSETGGANEGLIEDQSNADVPSDAKNGEQDEAATIEARKKAEKVIEDEAAKNIGGFSMFVIIALFGYGIYQLFASGWVGVLWIMGGFIYFVIMQNHERKKLMGEAE